MATSQHPNWGIEIDTTMTNYLWCIIRGFNPRTISPKHRGRQRPTEWNIIPPHWRVYWFPSWWGRDTGPVRPRNPRWERHSRLWRSTGWSRDTSAESLCRFSCLSACWGLQPADREPRYKNKSSTRKSEVSGTFWGSLGGSVVRPAGRIWKQDSLKLFTVSQTSAGNISHISGPIYYSVICFYSFDKWSPSSGWQKSHSEIFPRQPYQSLLEKYNIFHPYKRSMVSITFWFQNKGEWVSLRADIQQSFREKSIKQDCPLFSFLILYFVGSFLLSSPREERRVEATGFRAFQKQRHDNLVFTLNLIQNTAQCDKGDIEVRWRYANGDEQSLHIQAVCHASYRSQG